MAYDYQGAINAGANPNDVVNYLSTQTGYKAQDAIKAGAKQADVLKYMSSLPVAPINAGATPATPVGNQSNLLNYFSQVGTNLKNTFVQGAQDLNTESANQPKLASQAGGGIVGNTLAKLSTAGNAAGTVAQTAGGIIGSFISPALPDSVKNIIGHIGNFLNDKIQSIPGMTPQIHQSLTDVLNTASLLGLSLIHIS